jgi:hypothetical protein
LRSTDDSRRVRPRRRRWPHSTPGRPATGVLRTPRSSAWRYDALLRLGALLNRNYSVKSRHRQAARIVKDVMLSEGREDKSGILHSVDMTPGVTHRWASHTIWNDRLRSHSADPLDPRLGRNCLIPVLARYERRPVGAY